MSSSTEPVGNEASSVGIVRASHLVPVDIWKYKIWLRVKNRIVCITLSVNGFARSTGFFQSSEFLPKDARFLKMTENYFKILEVSKNVRK